MSKKMVDGIEMSDDIPVTEYDGKLSGTFELEHEMAAKMGYDDIVYLVVTARLDSYSFKPTKFGDLKRVNTFKIDSVSVKTHDEAKSYQIPTVFRQEELLDEPKWSLNDDQALEEFAADDPYAGGFQVLGANDEEIDPYTPQVVSKGVDYADPVLARFLEDIS